MRLAAVFLAMVLTSCSPATSAPPAPEFTHGESGEWLNSPPQTLAALRGKVVLIEFWTFGCSNCRNTLPWLKAVHHRFEKDGLVIVSVHTPEFPNEREPEQVRAAVKRLGISYAVMLDNDFSYWKALRNQYWPAFYLVGRDGRIAATAIGELHRGQARGDQMENTIARLLATPAT